MEENVGDLQVNKTLYKIWKWWGYTKWRNYKLFRIWSWVGNRLGFSNRLMKEM